MLTTPWSTIVVEQGTEIRILGAVLVRKAPLVKAKIAVIPMRQRH